MTKRTGIRDVAARRRLDQHRLQRAQPARTPSATARERVRTAADDLGYVPLQAARQLRVGRSGLLGMTVINIGNPFFAALVSGAEEAATAAGYRILVGNSDDDVAKERGHLELFERVQVEGVLVSPVRRPEPRRSSACAHAASPSCSSTPSTTPARCRPCRSTTSPAAGSRSSTCCRPGGAASPSWARGKRCARCASACRARGWRWPRIRMPRSTSSGRRARPRGVGRTLGADIAAAPPGSRPDGILATNDHLACGVVYGLISNGVRVPEDIAVIGYDDIEFASVAAVPLTSVRQPAREMGRHAGELLLAPARGRVHGEPLGSVMFQPELVVRASSVLGA